MLTQLRCATALVAVLAAPIAAFADAAPDAAPDAVSDYAVVDRIAGADGGWDYASLDIAGGRLYVSRATGVMAVDLATHKVIDALAPANGAHASFAIDNGRTVVETDGHTGLTRFINAATGKVDNEIASGQKPDAAAYDPVSGRVVVMSPGSNTVTEIDARARKVVMQFTLAGGLEAAEADGKGHVWVNLEDAGAVSEIDAVAGKVVRTIKLPGCEGPTGLALVAGGTRVISACANGVASVTDTASGKVVATLAIDQGPDFVLVDEGRHRAFIPCGASGTLVEIATDNPDAVHVIAHIPTQISARTGGLDPRDGRIYLPAAKFEAPAPGQRRGKQVPGSFVVLVVAPQK